MLVKKRINAGRIHEYTSCMFSSLPTFISNSFHYLPFLQVVVSNAPQAYDNSYYSCSERHPVRGMVAEPPVRALPLPIMENNGVRIVNPSFSKIS